LRQPCAHPFGVHPIREFSHSSPLYALHRALDRATQSPKSMTGVYQAARQHPVLFKLALPPSIGMATIASDDDRTATATALITRDMIAPLCDCCHAHYYKDLQFATVLDHLAYWVKPGQTPQFHLCDASHFLEAHLRSRLLVIATMTPVMRVGDDTTGARRKKPRTSGAASVSRRGVRLASAEWCDRTALPQRSAASAIRSTARSTANTGSRPAPLTSASA
jgi:hypothetical protein